MLRALWRRGWRSGSSVNPVPKPNPQGAVTAFLERFRAALCVLDNKGQIVIPRQGSWVTGKHYSWVLNPQKGMKLGDAGTLYASMQFEVIDYGLDNPNEDEFGQRFEVNILGYNYRLEQSSGGDRWRMHWHPEGISDVREPHLHIPPDLKVHRPCDSMTFETAIRWCIKDGAPLTCAPQEAERKLTVTYELPTQRAPGETNGPQGWDIRHD